MAVYAIGDVQGCHNELLQLLAVLHFDPLHDRLWLTGDLVNRGTQSLEVLRFVKSLGDRATVVLGNHDLHLLAVAAGVSHPRPKDSFMDVLAADDRDSLLSWLRQRPLFHHDPRLGYALVHAGLPPQWDLAGAQACAAEAEQMLRSDAAKGFFQQMYGDQPLQWRADLSGVERLRFIINCFTRLRYCDGEGRLALRDKGAPGKQTGGIMPWFQVPGRNNAGLKIIFGHWSTLGRYQGDGVYSLDTGCVWGRSLTALRLDDGEWFSISCAGACAPGED
jgi:bis(5'-nucleosyl)-tetraphosphatase (symmetrical)